MPSLNKILLPLFDAEDATISGGGNEELDANSILDALNKADSDRDPGDESDNLEEDKESPKEKEKEETEEDEEKDEIADELKELEEELKEPTEEDLELKTPVQRRALMKDYPDIFKKHPGLESTIYRERAYTELLPTIQDAKQALESAKTLDFLEKDLNEGNTIRMMQAVKDEDPKGFAKIADNYMPNLAKVSIEAHDLVVSNITKDIVEAMLTFGKEKGNEEIQSAASLLYQFMFNSTKWQPKQKLSADEVIDSSVSAEKQKLERERNEFEESKKNEHTSKLMGSIDNQIKGTIDKSIDPKGQMSDFVKSKAIDEVLAKATKLMKSDSRFQTIIKQLTDKAGKEKYSDEAMQRIKSAYYSKYKALLIPIIQSVRKEALKGTSQSKSSKKEEINDTTERANRDIAVRKGKSENNDKTKPTPGESSLDFLLRRA